MNKTMEEKTMKKRRNQTKTKETEKVVAIVKTESGIVRKSPDIPSLIEEFLAAQDIRQTSKEVYRQGVRRFIDWILINRIDQPIREDILRFKTDLKESGLSVNTINSYLTSTKRFFAWLHTKFDIPDVTKGVDNFSQPKGHLRESLTDSQVAKITNKIDISTIQGKRNFAMLTLMAESGLRTASIIGLNLGDLKHLGKEAKLFYRGKGSDEKDKFSLLQEYTLKAIMIYIKARGKMRREDPLFCSHSDRNNGQRLTTRTLRGIIKGLLRDLDLDDPRLSAHSFRHFFATNSLSNGADVYSVSRAMGHASIETTQIYLHELDRLGKGAAERFVTYERREISL